MAILPPQAEAAAIIGHYLKALTTATGRRWTPANDADMQRLNVLMAQIADEAPADTIPPYRALQELPSAPSADDPAASDPAYREWRRLRADADRAAVKRMLASGNGRGS